MERERECMLAVQRQPRRSRIKLRRVVLMWGGRRHHRSFPGSGATKIPSLLSPPFKTTASEAAIWVIGEKANSVRPFLLLFFPRIIIRPRKHEGRALRHGIIGKRLTHDLA